MQIAHIFIRDQKRREQTVYEHCKKTAEYAAQNLERVGLDRLGTLAGCLHDMGKCKQEMQTYLNAAANGEKVRRGSVNHTFAGVVYLLEKYHTEDDSTNCQDEDLTYRKITCELAAYAIGAHHGLFDCIGEHADGEIFNGFSYRLEKRDEIDWEETKQNFFSECFSEEEIDALFREAQQQVKDFGVKRGKNRCDNKYNLGMMARLLASALIDADRRDTAEFMQGIEIKPTVVDWESELAYTEEKLRQFPGDTPIDRARREISEQCRKSAERETGIYRLTVPTGAGKTLASLRYAQAHAKKYHKSRIIYVIPLLSVIEQNVDVWRRFVQNPETILEHHSNVINAATQDKKADPDEKIDPYENASVLWDSPYIVTTLVQLLSALFSGKTECVRRMHALSGSVLILDEVQSLPTKMLSLFTLAMNFLTTCCDMTLVLCSATQPPFDALKHPLRLAPNPELVSPDATTQDVFRRTELSYCGEKQYSQEEICDAMVKQFEKEPSVLTICNTKATAKGIFEKIQERLPEVPCYYLSTSLCPQHRRDMLKQITCALEAKKPVVCVSTQLVEAGVDFSFSCVFRIVAGLDHIAQSAGRCNRNGEWMPRRGQVIILQTCEEDLQHLMDIRLTQAAFRSFIYDYQGNPRKYNEDMLSRAAIDFYYEKFWNEGKVKENFEYPIEKEGKTLVALLSENRDRGYLGSRERYIDREKGYSLHQAFKKAGNCFSVFDQDTTDVIVPYNEEARDIIHQLQRAETTKDFALLEKNIKRARPYTVSLYSNELQTMEENGGLCRVMDGRVIFLLQEYYSAKVGVLKESSKCIIC